LKVLGKVRGEDFCFQRLAEAFLAQIQGNLKMRPFAAWRFRLHLSTWHSRGLGALALVLKEAVHNVTDDVKDISPMCAVRQ